jgi:glycosyltransferase involved in cell wall biosynthesis
MTVSVVMPVLNGERFIGEAVRSALSQGPSVHEVLVVDDGSTDASVAVVAAIGDDRITVLDQPAGVPGGVSAARNRGLRSATGRWVMFLDADDRLRPGAVDRLLAALPPDDEAGGYVAAYGGYERIDDAGDRVDRRPARLRRKPSGDVVERLLTGNFIGNGGVLLVRRDVFVASGGFDERLRYGEDWQAWCVLAAAGPMVYVPADVLEYRVHPSSAMAAARDMEDFGLVLDAIFEHPRIVDRLPPAARNRLRRSAETHLLTNLACLAVRAGRRRDGARQAGRAITRNPRRAPFVVSRTVAAALGL